MKPIFRREVRSRIVKKKKILYFFPILTNNEVKRQFQKTPKFNKTPFRILGLLHIGQTDKRRIVERILIVTDPITN
jgi:hypothetical protein